MSDRLSKDGYKDDVKRDVKHGKDKMSAEKKESVVSPREKDLDKSDDNGDDKVRNSSNIPRIISDVPVNIHVSVDPTNSDKRSVKISKKSSEKVKNVPIITSESTKCDNLLNKEKKDVDESANEEESARAVPCVYVIDDGSFNDESDMAEQEDPPASPMDDINLYSTPIGKTDNEMEEHNLCSSNVRRQLNYDKDKSNSPDDYKKSQIIKTSRLK